MEFDNHRLRHSSSSSLHSGHCQVPVLNLEHPLQYVYFAQPFEAQKDSNLYEHTTKQKICEKKMSSDVIITFVGVLSF